MLSNHNILCHPLLYVPSIFPSIRVLSNELALQIRQPKYWNFNFSINLSKSYNQPKLPLTSTQFSWFFPWGTCRNHLPLSLSASFLQTDNSPFLSMVLSSPPSLAVLSPPLWSQYRLSLCVLLLEWSVDSKQWFTGVKVPWFTIGLHIYCYLGLSKDGAQTCPVNAGEYDVSC